MRWQLTASFASITSIASIVGSPAFAASPDDALRLTWTAPKGCPSTESVRAATLRGVDARAAKGEVLEVDARVDQAPMSGGTWKVQLRTRRGASLGEREIEAATCDSLAEATAVVLALALVTSETEPPEPETPSPVIAPAPRATEEDSPAASPSPRAMRADTEHGFAFGASLAADAATLPATALGGSLTLAWTPGRFRVEVDARRWSSQSGSIDVYGSGARFSMTSVGGRGCWAALKEGRFQLGPCGGADVHLVSAPGFGADTNYAPDAAWTALAGGALARVALTSWLAARGRIEAVVPLSRPNFIVENEGDLHRPAALGAAASVGLEALFL